MSKIDKDTDFFAYVDNFAKYKHVKSTQLYGKHRTTAPKVSIVIPTYRRPELLKEAVESAINQDGYDDYEIVIVDNDATGEFTAHIIAMLNLFNDIKIIYYRNQENIGMFGNWNRCIELATGEWVTILNDDDILFKYYLASMTINCDDVDRVECKCLEFSNANDVIQEPPFVIKKYKATDYFVYILNNYNLGTHSMLFRRDKLIEIGGYNDTYYPSSDYILNATYLFYNKSTLFLQWYLCGYRWGENESLKRSTRFGFFRVYSYFGQYILSKSHVSKFFSFYFLMQKMQALNEVYKRQLLRLILQPLKIFKKIIFAKYYKIL